MLAKNVFLMFPPVRLSVDVRLCVCLCVCVAAVNNRYDVGDQGSFVVQAMHSNREVLSSGVLFPTHPDCRSESV